MLAAVGAQAAPGMQFVLNGLADVGVIHLMTGH
jgi:hypothetical protein